MIKFSFRLAENECKQICLLKVTRDFDNLLAPYGLYDDGGVLTRSKRSPTMTSLSNIMTNLFFVF